MHGMIEQYLDNQYSVYGTTNEDVFTWKEYPEHIIELNNHEMYQMKLNIQDATIMGTDNHQDKMVVVQNRYQLRLNYDLMK